MATEIKQVDDHDGRVTTLRVKGEILRDDAMLIERIATDIRRHTGYNVTIDLADLAFVDSEAAPVLKRIEMQDGFDIAGIEIFLQSIVDRAERQGT